MIGSVIEATLIGVSTAWVTYAYDFKGIPPQYIIDSAIGYVCLSDGL